MSLRQHQGQAGGRQVTAAEGKALHDPFAGQKHQMSRHIWKTTQDRSLGFRRDQVPEFLGLRGWRCARGCHDPQQEVIQDPKQIESLEQNCMWGVCRIEASDSMEMNKKTSTEEKG